MPIVLKTYCLCVDVQCHVSAAARRAAKRRSSDGTVDDDAVTTPTTTPRRSKRANSSSSNAQSQTAAGAAAVDASKRERVVTEPCLDTPPASSPHSDAGQNSDVDDDDDTSETPVPRTCYMCFEGEEISTNTTVHSVDTISSGSGTAAVVEDSNPLVAPCDCTGGTR
jgi:hypothetical protein